MNEWFSAQKLVGLPGLPGTVQGINSRAIRDSWQQRKHMGRGGGREYHISSLPDETRAALLNAALGEVATKVVRQETQLALVETNRQQLVADARQGVLHALDLMMARTGYSRKRSITLMLDMARLGQVEPQLLAMLKMARDPRGRPSADGLPSVRSLERFLDQAERGALVPKVRRPDRGSGGGERWDGDARGAPSRRGQACFGRARHSPMRTGLAAPRPSLNATCCGPNRTMAVEPSLKRPSSAPFSRRIGARAASS